MWKRGKEKEAMKKLISILLAALGLFITTIALADDANTVSYVERSWNGTQVVSADKTRTAVSVPSDGRMTSGWYYLNTIMQVFNDMNNRLTAPVSVPAA